METNLILTAQTWQLAAQIESSGKHGGVIVLKNTPEHTYLCITPEQWQVLLQFRQPRNVPQVLEHIIDERLCPPLGEFYELVLKAVRARILVPPPGSYATFPAMNWPVSIRPASVRGVLWTIFALGCVAAIGFRPELPDQANEIFAGLGACVVALAVGRALSASLLRGAEREVYRHRWLFVDLSDACMLPPTAQRTVALGELAVLAALAGFLAWYRPAWGFMLIAGLLVRLRPMLGGTINQLIRVGGERRLSDAEHAFQFGPNRSARVRLGLLRIALRNASTWLELFYAALWTIAIGYFVGSLAEVPPWKLAFWQANGTRLAYAFCGSLALLAIVYLGSEFYLWIRARAVARHQTLRESFRRWFQHSKVPTDEADRARAVGRSPLLRQLTPPAQQALVREFRPETHRAWQYLPDDFGADARFGLILSGRIGVYRRNRSGRPVRIAVLCENDLVGAHAACDPDRPEYVYRTLSPVVLLRADGPAMREHVLGRYNGAALANFVLKLPFLSRISLCQNWHLQSIQRFAELARVANYGEGDVVLPMGVYGEHFYIVLEGTAYVRVKSRQVGRVRAEGFFGEIGLLQNSSSTAEVVAGPDTRCLCVARREFLRFVAHNYAVALRLERVSSQRLGRPIFPLTPGNFRVH